MPARPTLHLIVGINGAGKTTFYREFLRMRTPGAEFVNADEIEAERWPDAIGKHSYEAGELAAARRDALLGERKSFVTETVFSHPSKLELIERTQERGFHVILYHVHVSSPELAAARVETRVSEGGHGVPAEKVSSRHPRVLKNVAEGVRRADKAYVFDNSRLGRGFTWVMSFSGGRIERLGDLVPDWARKTFRGPLRNHLGSLRTRT